MMVSIFENLFGSIFEKSDRNITNNKNSVAISGDRNTVIQGEPIKQEGIKSDTPQTIEVRITKGCLRDTLEEIRIEILTKYKNGDHPFSDINNGGILFNVDTDETIELILIGHKQIQLTKTGFKKTDKKVRNILKKIYGWKSAHKYLDNKVSKVVKILDEIIKDL